jgi:DNA polymerase-1
MAPPVACVSVADAGSTYLLRDFPRELLTVPTLVTAHGAYDFAAIAATWPDTLPAIVRAYEEDRIQDVLTVQKLQDNYAGILGGFDDDEDSGKSLKIKYNLDDLAQRHRIGRKVNAEWQARFGELMHIPIEQWPESAKTYAKTDARITFDVRLVQDEFMPMCPDHIFQARAAFWLQLMTVWGICTNPKGVEDFARKTRAEKEIVAADLRAVGLLRPDHTLKSGPRKGQIEPGSRNVNRAREMLAKAYEAQGESPPRTKGDEISTSRVACAKSGSKDLVKYSEFSALAKVLSTDVPTLLAGVRWPIHTRIEHVLTSGRTSSKQPNIQNVRRKPGLRECFVPRPLRVFVACDYAGLELCTLAETMFFLFGRSTLGDVLNAGRDPHLEMVPPLLQRPEDEIFAIYKDPNHKMFGWVKNARNSAKVANFGFPGGCGAETFVSYALQSYNVEVSIDQSRQLRRLWFDRWYDMPDYFSHVSRLVDSGEPVVLPYSNRARGRCCFTEACNIMFQGPGSDIAKTAGWLIMRACYVEPDSVLYQANARIVNFVHDEFILECDAGWEHEVALELERLMLLGAEPWLRHVRIKVESVAMKYWSKDAKRVHKDGRLIAWG